MLLTANKEAKEMINKYGHVPKDQVILERERFRPNWRKGHVLTKPCTTSYSPIYDKGKNSNNKLRAHNLFIGMVDEAYNIYPYGYIGVAVSDPLKNCC